MDIPRSAKPKLWVAGICVVMIVACVIYAIVGSDNVKRKRSPYITYYFRNLDVTITSDKMYSLFHQDNAVFYSLAPWEAKLDCSDKAYSDALSSYGQWSVKHWVWNAYNADGFNREETFRRWEVYYRQEADGVVFVAFHPFGVVFWGRVADVEMLRDWVGNIDLIQHG